ncbi:MAG: 3-dehydroquinate dehydratase [Melioribacteraceae bacterium]|nr:3-dehydroquinate dehydratase [Melioribacteraceae bacterium]
MKIIVINGPNLNMLGARDHHQYGTESLENLESELKRNFEDVDFVFVQSNLEGEIINFIQGASDNYDALIINPAGYSHTSVAIRDSLEICKIPKIEVHLSNISDREDFRSKSITASKTNGYISGFKKYSYFAAVYLAKILIANK